MKKLLILLLLSGCGYATIDNSKKAIITSIEVKDNTLCYYYGKGDIQNIGTIVGNDFRFTDSCGKFQIGDTIKFIK